MTCKLTMRLKQSEMKKLKPFDINSARQPDAYLKTTYGGKHSHIIDRLVALICSFINDLKEI